MLKHWKNILYDKWYSVCAIMKSPKEDFVIGKLGQFILNLFDGVNRYDGSEKSSGQNYVDDLDDDDFTDPKIEPFNWFGDRP